MRKAKSQDLRKISVVLLAVIATLMMTLRVEYVPLFDSSTTVNLKPVVDYFDENNIKYKKGTNQVFVDSRKKKDIEFDLSQALILRYPLRTPGRSFPDGHRGR